MTEIDLNPFLPPLAEAAHVLIMGGSFNPPHIAHALCGHTALMMTGADALFVLPTGQHAFGKALAPYALRLAMAEATFAQLERAFVLDIERHLPPPHFTVQTLRSLRKARPQHRFTLVVGSDILDELDRWREPEALKSMASFFVVPRTGYSRAGTDVDVVLPEVSSTAIRNAIATGDPVPRVLTPEVAAVIDAQGLYTDTP